MRDLGRRLAVGRGVRAGAYGHGIWGTLFALYQKYPSGILITSRLISPVRAIMQIAFIPVVLTNPMSVASFTLSSPVSSASLHFA